ncbi:hypothetical protein [Microbacterium phyllosphaerae]|uniref:hypothetical protein n=1 Tax=Microbacterium phyllosphaerae TaxID=124798 RepID=UPI0021687517|nr:hypothetical protein [Microbacterium phyllosphaerae]MCS3442169.1 hypothetical protein [Microbacterium phyllosphaerae]
MTDDEESIPWAAIVGPCYTVTSMARTLGWSEAEVMAAGDDLRLLMLRISDDVYLFPAFQFHDGHVAPGLTKVLRILQTETRSQWTWALWLNVELPGQFPPRNIQRLIDGRLEEAIRDAERDAWFWQS